LAHKILRGPKEDMKPIIVATGSSGEDEAIAER
jgi:hypothetical protein